MDIEFTTRTLSDHTHLMMKHKFQNYGALPFKFYNSWMKEQDFEEVIGNSWESYQHNSKDHRQYTLAKKIKSLKQDIKKWRCGKKENQKIEKNNILNKSDAIDANRDQGACEEQESVERDVLINNLKKIERMEAEDFKQINKNKWNLEWDENSKLFHRNINKKKRKNGIKGIMLDNVWRTDPNQVKNTLFEHFAGRFKQEPRSKWRQGLTGLKRIVRTIESEM